MEHCLANYVWALNNYADSVQKASADAAPLTERFTCKTGQNGHRKRTRKWTEPEDNVSRESNFHDPTPQSYTEANAIVASRRCRETQGSKHTHRTCRQFGKPYSRAFCNCAWSCYLDGRGRTFGSTSAPVELLDRVIGPLSDLGEPSDIRLHNGSIVADYGVSGLAAHHRRAGIAERLYFLRYHQRGFVDGRNAAESEAAKPQLGGPLRLQGEHHHVHPH
ncbi:hypothetical protein [Aureimonas altamirensis]|uniref:hypothetical protein n=1 Tax=Aureimonas altamirensis TaxID=370622 RepID=UPI002553086B|nr:hypothetical protein [Aureimonas altamirensis]